MREHSYFVYMMASKLYGTLYTGVTNNLIGRAQQHKDGTVPGFTQKYGVTLLVWYEWHEDINAAIACEKKIKRWRRDWRIALIEKDNPRWVDLHPSLLSDGSRVSLRSPGMTVLIGTMTGDKK
jgi:putative endonuclease